MQEHRWFIGHDQAPGAVLFRTDRTVHVSYQTASHRQLLLRAIDNDHPTRLDLLFKAVDEQHLHSSYDGLVVRCPTEADTTGPDVSTTFILESGGIRDHVSARAFGWQEEERTNLGPGSLTAMMLPLPFAPPWWEGDPDFAAYRPSGPMIPLGDLVDALSAGEAPQSQQDGFRDVHTVVIRITRTLPGGGEDQRTVPVAVYLTRGEAEDAIRAEIAAKAATIWRAEQPGAVIQDKLVARSLAEIRIERWVVAVPVRL
jgi:hypothetical protein